MKIILYKRKPIEFLGTIVRLFKQFHANAPFLYPLKILEKQNISGLFRGHKKGISNGCDWGVPKKKQLLSWRPATLLKRGFNTDVFAKILSAPFLTVHLRWLLLPVKKYLQKTKKFSYSYRMTYTTTKQNFEFTFNLRKKLTCLCSN